MLFFCLGNAAPPPPHHIDQSLTQHGMAPTLMTAMLHTWREVDTKI